MIINLIYRKINNLKKNNIKLLIIPFLYIFLFSIFIYFKPFLKFSLYSPSKNYLPNIIILIVLFSSYILYAIASRYLTNKNTFKITIIFLVLISSVSLFSYPLGSGDLFVYTSQAREFSVFKLNPYYNTYEDQNIDPHKDSLLNYWSDEVSVYGPFFILIAGLLAKINSSSLIFTLFIFKIFFSIINIGNLILIKKITNNNLAVYLYGFCPVILFEFLVNAHNDVLLIFFILLSFLFLKKEANLKNYSLALLFLIISFF